MFDRRKIKRILLYQTNTTIKCCSTRSGNFRYNASNIKILIKNRSLINNNKFCYSPTLFDSYLLIYTVKEKYTDIYQRYAIDMATYQ